jgi:hypothetical protein
MIFRRSFADEQKDNLESILELSGLVDRGEVYFDLVFLLENPICEKIQRLAEIISTSWTRVRAPVCLQEV